MAKMPKGNGIRIRKFASSDLHAVKNLIRHTINICYSGVYPKEVIKFFLDYHNDRNILKEAKEGYTIVLRRNNRIVGTGTIIGDHILRVFVHPKLQKQGFGKLIMQKLEAKAVSAGVKTINLDASLPSKKFYDSLDYTSVKASLKVENGKRLNYYKMKKALQGREIESCEKG
jgi:N-acetylglutamate synthase-like GNAT family acetyltransferase